MKTQNKGFLYPEEYHNVNGASFDFPLPNNRHVCRWQRLTGPWLMTVLSPEHNLDDTVYCNVPFPVETPYSGVNFLPEPGTVLRYEKRVDIASAPENTSPVLVFQSVSQSCKIYADGFLLAEHTGAFTPFEVDLGPVLAKNRISFNLVVEVTDPVDSTDVPTGKMTLNPNFCFYTSNTGIIGDVVLQYRREGGIDNVLIIPDVEKQRLKVLVKTKATNRLAELVIGNESYYVKTGEWTDVWLSSPLPLWTLENPQLVKFHVTLNGDTFEGAFGYRSFGTIRKGETDYFALNGKPVLIKGLLDQGYYYKGGYVPKNYQTLKKELENVKALGFNCLRVHMRTMPPQYLDLCDFLGLLVIQDFPCGGKRPYKLLTKLGLLKDGRRRDYKDYRLFGREDAEGRKMFEQMGEEIVEGVANHPSVVMFTIFNEGWGQFDSTRLYKKFKALDSSRLYDTASGWYDNDHSDVYSLHRYFFYNPKLKAKGHRPFFLSEIGGLDKIPNKTIVRLKPKARFVRHPLASWNLNKAYQRLFVKRIVPLIQKKGLAGFVYTQLSDVEGEYNGLFDCERRGFKTAGMQECIQKMNKLVETEFEKKQSERR